MRRLALYIAFKYTIVAGIILAFLWRLEYPSPLGMAWLPVAASVYGVVLHAICPPALRSPIRESPGRFVTRRGMFFITWYFAFMIGGCVVLHELGRAGLISFIVEPGTRVVSVSLVIGLLVVVLALSAADLMAKKDRLDHASENNA